MRRVAKWLTKSTYTGQILPLASKSPPDASTSVCCPASPGDITPQRHTIRSVIWPNRDFLPRLRKQPLRLHAAPRFQKRLFRHLAFFRGIGRALKLDAVPVRIGEGH